ncbi:hypothetical protein Cgig2_028329 [Carnegiea gigantea]|uniref:Uncharacterized protein n=1 Tax=Carnegiea gigantea TaxID=171969 RepID=A0A9Q1KJ80_9CARY|nr:hypothetical protein Cgig2_028329 [Carnegiea gigantea]
MCFIHCNRYTWNFISMLQVSNAYLKLRLGPSAKVLLEFVKEMPKPGTRLRLDVSSLLSAQFFTYVIIALFPTILTALVYEKQQRLRIMMKMHGLGDAPYWMISYAYFLAMSLIYMISFVIFGSAIAVWNLIVFSGGWIIMMELYPGFSLFRSLYELGQYSFLGDYMGSHGTTWSNLSDSMNGMREVLMIMVLEWLLVLPVAFYIDQVASSGSAVKKNPPFFLRSLRKRKKSLSGSQQHGLQRQESKVFVEMEKADVAQEAVYMDEPSTGLDPASRNDLWNVVKEAKQQRAIILTSNGSSFSHPPLVLLLHLLVLS